MGKPVKFTKGLTRTQVHRQARKCFPGIHGPKLNAPEIPLILSMQSMIPETFIGKRPEGAVPYGPLNVKRVNINSKTNTEKLLKTLMPKLKYDTKFPPHRVRQYQEAISGFSAPFCLLLQLNSIGCSDLNKLRLNLADASVELAYVRSSILEFFCKKNNFNELAKLCKGPLMIAYSQLEPSKLKPAFSLIENCKKIITLSGIVEGQLYAPSDCRQLIQIIPSRNQLMAGLVGILQSPQCRLSDTLESSMYSLSDTLHERMKQMQIEQ